MKATQEFISLNITVLTISRSRTPETDTSGTYLCAALQDAGHRFQDRILIDENKYQIRAVVSAWIADKDVQVILVNGGTGLTDRDVTPEALAPLFDRDIIGFGELFRQLSLTEIGSATMQSRSMAGMANKTLVFCLPGSTAACKMAWDQILFEQLNSTFSPCNFVGLLQ